MPETEKTGVPDIEDKIAGLLASRLNKVEQKAYVEYLLKGESPGRLLNTYKDADLGPALKEQLNSIAVIREAREKLFKWERSGISATVMGAGDYPFLLSQVAAAPLILFYRGRNLLRLSSAICLSVVGARNADLEGREIAAEVAKTISGAGGCVVSGLAYGIDSVAHAAALEVPSTDMPTIAVLGNGLDTVYPSAHRQLAADILDRNGLIISQFEPGERPYPSNFLNRNRVIAGLSKGTIVIQAARRSGSLSTARYALEEGRDVCAVPGSIFNSRHQGTNSLIKQGAFALTSSNDVLELFPELEQKKSESGSQHQKTVSQEQAHLMKALNDDQMHYDELAELTGERQNFARVLLELELMGLVQRLPGNYIRRCSPM